MAAPQFRQPVLADVARVAGVSVPTVSRVLTGSTPVSPERRERVMQAIEELGYRPNGAARALVQGRQPLVAVLAGNTSRFGYASTIEGIEEAARAAGFIVVITVVETADEVVVKNAVDLVLGQPVAGAIVLEYDQQGTAAITAMPKALPHVSVAGASLESTRPSAFMDDRAAAQVATKYLLDLGHRTVHHVAIPDSGGPSGRAIGWREALRAAGAPVPEIVPADWGAASGHEVAQRLLGRADVSAVLCGNDEVAIGLLRACAEAGISVPDDLSVVGFDDHPLARFWTPPLTTVAQDFAELGRRTFAVLHDLMLGREVSERVRLVPELLVRASAGPPRPRSALHH